MSISRFVVGILVFASASVAHAACDVAADGDYFVDKDHPAANDSNVGSADLPFVTIQHMIDLLGPGDCAFVRESSVPYFEDVRKSGSNRGGITIDVEGTPTDRIIISGFPGERPVIDIDRRNSTDENKEMAGFLVRNGNYVTIRNFEIRRASAPGIFMSHNIRNTGITVEKMYIHHIYGGDNIGAVRLDLCHRCLVRDNVFHDIYDTRRDSNTLTDEPYGLHAGVHGYRPAESIIEHNLIYNVARGVYEKQSNYERLASNEVRYNVFRNIEGPAYEMSKQGSSQIAGNNASFHHNIVLNAESGLRIRWKGAGSQGRDVSVYNNTFINTDTIVAFSNVDRLEVYNNAIVGTNERVCCNVIFSAEDPGDGLINGVQYLDYNFFSADANQDWLFNRYTAELVVLHGLSELQAFGFGDSSEIGDLRVEGSGDYTLLPENVWSVAGRNGDQIGAAGAIQVGPRSAGISVPKPPEDLVVNSQ